MRANFIFLMGGHVEDEIEEAEHSHEIQEGRLENNARKDISAAIHQMSLSRARADCHRHRTGAASREGRSRGVAARLRQESIYPAHPHHAEPD